MIIENKKTDDHGFEVYLRTVNGKSGLVQTGLPFSTGVLHPGEKLQAIGDKGTVRIPLCFEITSLWPDGSVRWIFLQAVLPEGCQGFTVSKTEDEQPSDAEKTAHDHAKNISVQVRSRGMTLLSEGEPVITVESAEVPASRQGDEEWNISKTGDDLFAPLFRVSGSSGGFVHTEFLIRADLTGGVFTVTFRRSFPSSGTVRLSKISSKITLGKAFSDEASAEITDQDRRGPVSALKIEKGCFELVMFPEDEDITEVLGGISLRQEIRIGRKDRLTAPLLKIDPGYICSSGVFGNIPVLDSEEMMYIAPGISGGLKRLMSKAADGYREFSKNRAAILDDGDWPLNPGQYGSKDYTGFTDNEYDAPFAFFLAHASTGDPAYLETALRCAKHMADIDCSSDCGDMLYHGYDDEAEDHRTHRVRKGDPGHYWTDGLWNAYFWSGDIFAKEAAEALTEYIIDMFEKVSPEEAFSICERNIGWPMMVMVSMMETGTADSRAGDLCRKLTSFIYDYTMDPDAFYIKQDGGILWWRCAFRDGSKPFMLGVLGEALGRYHDRCGDEKAKEIIIHTARFISDTFDPVRMDYSYEFNAYGPGHREINAQQLIPLFIRTLLDGAALSGDEHLSERAFASLHASAWCLFDFETGKDIALMTRGFLPAAGRLVDFKRNAVRKYNESFSPSGGREMRSWISEGKGSTEYFSDPVFSDSGVIRIEYESEKLPADALNAQALVHFCGSLPYDSCVSAVIFYNRIQVRFYDSSGRLIDSLDHITDESFFKPGDKHIIDIAYETPGQAVMTIDGMKVSEATLTRHISGGFTMVMTGTKPGNWGVSGKVKVIAAFERSIK